ncbi:MAG: DUF924 family protein [Myxococcales bacterium]|jgi:uncharacterized protein (DUF924 family)
MEMFEMDQRTEEILGFWFGSLDELGRASAEQRKKWWTKSSEFDDEIKARFETDYDAVTAGEREGWRRSARGALAYIIVVDQFSRNMFRGTPRMFAADGLAREACREGLERGFREALAFDERVFFYLPLEHSEDLTAQRRCAKLFEAEVEQAPDALKADAQYYLDFAERHRAIIERFGRFPHRNEILNRESTPEELAFLNEPGSSF